MRDAGPKRARGRVMGPFGKQSSLLLGAMLLALGNGLFHSVVGLRMVSRALPAIEMGAVATSFYAGSLLGALRGAATVEKVGHIRAFAAYAAILACVTLAHLMTTSTVAWVALRTVGGYCLVVLVMVVESWLNAVATRQTRGRVLARYMIVTFGSLSLAQLLLNVASPADTQLFLISAILFSAALVPLALTRVEEPTSVPTERMTFAKLYALSPLAMYACLASGFTTPAIYSLGAVAAKGLAMTTAEVSVFLALTIGGGLALQWPFGWMSDAVDRRVALLTCAVLAGLFASGIAATGDTGTAVTRNVLGFALGGAIFAVYPIGVAIANDHAAAADAIEVSRGLLFVFSLGGAVAPLVGGLAMAIFGPSGLFLQIATVAGLLVLAAVHAIRSRIPAPAIDRSSYVSVPQTSPAGSALDPRRTRDLVNETPTDATA